jgi:hypothetical protein
MTISHCNSEGSKVTSAISVLEARFGVIPGKLGFLSEFGP